MKCRAYPSRVGLSRLRAILTVTRATIYSDLVLETTFLEPLLAQRSRGGTVFASGLTEAHISSAPEPRTAPAAAEAPLLAAYDEDPNQLPVQRWAVIAAHGSEGDALVAAVEPLMAMRAVEQHAEVQRLRIDAGLDSAAAWSWKKRVLLGQPELERPRYLFILGDIDQVSLETQQVLANGAFVGRLAADVDGARAYAHKLVNGATSDRGGRALFFTAEDGTNATTSGAQYVGRPCVVAARREQAAGTFGLRVERIAFGGSSATLVSAARDTGARLLFSLSHGLGNDSDGWTEAQARARQGSLLLGGDLLTADDVAAGSFLRGGLWFALACFSAAVPSRSEYYGWLQELCERGAPPDVLDRAHRSLAPGRPFVSAMPKAALANPDGPLAFIGHADLAWSFGFRDTEGESRYERVFSVLRSWSRGSRAGVAFGMLVSAYRDVNDELLAAYQARRYAAAMGQPDPTDPMRLGEMWMSRNDLRGYILLGDPAARLGTPHRD
jgi:hypothetical protein